MNRPSDGARDAFDLTAYLADRRRSIDRHLERVLPADEVSRLVRAMRHSLLAGGKRLRPILCLAAAEAVTAEPVPGLLETACALEFIHTYSLVHDDLPAMDDDDLRRGRPTCHRAFDEATAILAGDALLTRAFELLAAGTTGPDPEPRLAVIACVAAAAGPDGLIGGQMDDVLAEQTVVTPAQLESIHVRKTGALIRAALRCGGLLAGAATEQLDRLDRFGRCIGLAFQVTDDILDVEGDAALMGKPTGTDARHGKQTYPGLLGMTAAKRLARDLAHDAAAALSAFDRSADPLRALAAYIPLRRR